MAALSGPPPFAACQPVGIPSCSSSFAASSAGLPLFPSVAAPSYSSSLAAPSWQPASPSAWSAAGLPALSPDETTRAQAAQRHAVQDGFRRGAQIAQQTWQEAWRDVAASAQLSWATHGAQADALDRSLAEASAASDGLRTQLLEAEAESSKQVCTLEATVQAARGSAAALAWEERLAGAEKEELAVALAGARERRQRRDLQIQQLRAELRRCSTQLAQEVEAADAAIRQERSAEAELHHARVELATREALGVQSVQATLDELAVDLDQKRAAFAAQERKLQVRHAELERERCRQDFAIHEARLEARAAQLERALAR